MIEVHCRPSLEAIVKRLCPPTGRRRAQAPAHADLRQSSPSLQDLPLEIQRSVLAHLDKGDLAAFCLVSHASHRVAQPELYRELSFPKYFRLISKISQLLSSDAPPWAVDALASCRILVVTTTCQSFGYHYSAMFARDELAPKHDDRDMRWIKHTPEADYVAFRLLDELTALARTATGISDVTWNWCHAAPDLSRLFEAFDKASMRRLTLIDGCSDLGSCYSPAASKVGLLDAPGWSSLTFAHRLTSLHLSGSIPGPTSTQHSNSATLDDLLSRCSNLVELRLNFATRDSSSISWLVLECMGSLDLRQLTHLDWANVAAPSHQVMERFLTRHANITRLSLCGPAWSDLSASELPEGCRHDAFSLPRRGTFGVSPGATIMMPRLSFLRASSQRLLAGILSASKPSIVEGIATSLDPRAIWSIFDSDRYGPTRANAPDGNAIDVLALTSSIRQLSLMIYGDYTAPEWLAKLEATLRKVPPSVRVLSLRFPGLSLSASQTVSQQLPVTVIAPALAHLTELQLLALPQEAIHEKRVAVGYYSEAAGECQHRRLAAAEKLCVEVVSSLARKLPNLFEVVFMGSSYRDRHGFPRSSLAWNEAALSFAPTGCFAAQVTRLDGAVSAESDGDDIVPDDDEGGTMGLVSILAKARRHAYMVKEEERLALAPKRIMPPRRVKRKREAADGDDHQPDKASKRPKTEAEEDAAGDSEEVKPSFIVEIVQRGCCCRRCHLTENYARVGASCYSSSRTCSCGQ